MKAAVIGYPIHHSKSPMIHQHWLEEHGITGSYEAIEIKPGELEVKIAEIIERGYDGFNCTIPHKENIFDFCDEIDNTAKIIGAVNTVTIKNKKLIGKNTDAFGFIQNIKVQSDFCFKSKRALVIGAGGASRAILYGLLKDGVEKILLTNRTKEKAVNLQSLNPDKIKIIDWEEKENYLNEINLLVNATSLGMVGQHELNIDLKNLNKNALVTDIVYTPLMTPLLERASAQGNDIVTGVGMLLHQARPAFEAWTGILPDVTDALTAKILS